MTYGTIFDVKRFSLHDGEGIRTTLFLKGCPLSCPWCQNPEGLSPQIRLQWTPSQCIRCGLCVKACPVSSLSIEERTKNIAIDHSLCERTGDCTEECPTGALAFNGRRVSSEEIADELLRDRLFFDATGGGITLSGGEPLAQPEFTQDVLRIIKEAGVGTAIETTLYANRSVLESIMPFVDRFLVDQKIADEKKHKSTLGVDSGPIRENLEFLVRSGAPLLIRIPLIPGFTASDENLSALGNYIARIKPNPPPVELLNFNPLAESKYRTMKQQWPIPKGIHRYSEIEMERFAEIMRLSGLRRITI